MDDVNLLEDLNAKVDQLCACPGKEKTRSRRVEKELHEDWCWYHMYLVDQEKQTKSG